jgi:predicted Zn-dependent protease
VDAAECKELASAALGYLPNRAQAQATVSCEHSMFMRFANSQPTQATSVEDVGIELCVIENGHPAKASTNRSDATALSDLAEHVQQAAKDMAAGRPAGSYPTFSRPQPLRPRQTTGYDPNTARLRKEDGSTALAAVFEAASRHGVICHGVWTAAHTALGVCKTNGFEGCEELTDGFMKVTAESPEGLTGYATDTASSLDAIDAFDLAERATAKAAAACRPVTLEPGYLPVVFEPAAAAELLDWLGRLAFNGLSYSEGRSALCGRLGTKLTSKQIQLTDAPDHPDTLPRRFDWEGTPKAPLDLIADGVCEAICHDTQTASMDPTAGAHSTGHALSPAGAVYGAVPTNLVLAPGTAPDASALCRPIDYGVYVTRLWYTNPVRPRETVITGTTRDGTFLIENGEITRPAHDLRITDSVLEILARADELGKPRELVSDGEFYGRRFAHGTLCPALRTEAVRFSA